MAICHTAVDRSGTADLMVPTKDKTYIILVTLLWPIVPQKLILQQTILDSCVFHFASLSISVIGQRQCWNSHSKISPPLIGSVLTSRVDQKEHVLDQSLLSSAEHYHLLKSLKTNLRPEVSSIRLVQISHSCSLTMAFFYFAMASTFTF